MTTLIWLLPLPPLLAFLLIILFTNRNRGLSHGLALGAAGLSWLGSMVVCIRALEKPDLGQQAFESVINWLPTGATWFQIGVRVDPLSAVTLFFVSWTILMIFIYSIGYHNFGQPIGDHDQKGLPPHGVTIQDELGHSRRVMSVEPMYSRFFAFIGLFAWTVHGPGLLVSGHGLPCLAQRSDRSSCCGQPPVCQASPGRGRP